MNETIVNIVLIITGYIYDYNRNVGDPPLPIRNGAGGTKRVGSKGNKKRKLWKVVLGYAYNVFIGSLIIWRCFYTLYLSYREQSIVPFGRSLFQILFLFQYIQGIFYFRKEHFYKNISSSSEMISLFQRYVPWVTISISTILAVTQMVLLINGVNVHGYTDIYEMLKHDWQKAGVAMLLLFDSWFSYQTFTVNMCVFVINMVYNKRKVYNYAKSLEESYIGSTQGQIEKSQSIMEEYPNMREYYGETIKALNPFFGALNFIGFTSCYFALISYNKQIISADEITNIILFLAVEAIYMYSIQIVNKSISKIRGSVSNPGMIASFVTDISKTAYHHGHHDHHTHHDHSHVTRHTKSIPPVSSDYSSSYYGSYSEQDEEATIGMGGLTFGEVHQGHTHHPHAHHVPGMKNVSSMLNAIHMSSRFSQLKSILDDPWDSFSLFGIELSDTYILQKIVGVLLSIGILTQVSDAVNWIN